MLRMLPVRSVTISFIDLPQKSISSESALHERADARDRLADDQVLHLVGAFVRIQRLGIGEEARDVVVGNDAVAAQELAAPADGLACSRRAERLRERRVMVSELAFVGQLREP